MEITQVRNATLIVDYNDTRFLIDPWLGPKDYMPGFETAIHSEIRQPRVDLPFDTEKIVNVHAVIVTHVHPDHWDKFAEKALNKDIKLFVQSKNDQQFFITKGFNNTEILTESGTEYNKISLFKTATQHGKKEVVKPLCEKIGMPYDAMGVVFQAKNERTLYIAGDTIWCKEVSEVINRFTPDVIVVNACAATVLNGERLIMNIEDINNVLKAVPYGTIIASHMDTVSHLAVTRTDLKEFIQFNHIDNLLVPDDGETLSFPYKKEMA